MAKKPAPKKKTAPVKTAKPVQKSAAKPTKKPAAPVKASKVVKSVAKAAAKPAPKVLSKPAAKEKAVAKKPEPTAMTKKGKAVPEEKAPTKSTQSVISMMEETSAPEDASKAEKVSKIKPVKIERGNLADEKAKWAELYKKYGKEKAVNYKMSDTFATMLPMQHKVLGWGFVLTNENDRLEVLFETGIRMLISNYKA